MLQIMRNFTKSWMAKAFMSLLILSFGIWGIGDMFRGNIMQRTVAKVGKIVISYQALEREFQRALPEARRVFGPELSAPKARMMGVLDRTLTLMTENAKFDQEVKRLGINVSDDVILAKLAAQPELRDKNGNFNTKLWQEALSKGGYTERGFMDSERQSDARRMLFESLINNVKTPKVMVDNLYRAQGSKRILEVLSLDNASVNDIPKPDDAALQEFHQKHSDLFMVPEFRAITVARLSTNDVTKDVTVSDEELKKAYDERLTDFSHPEQRDFVQVVIQDEAKAKAFADTAKSKGNLAEAAKAQNLKPIDLNRIDDKSILPELYTTFFALESDQVSDAVKSGLGWHVVQLKKIYPAGQLSFDEAKPKLRETLQSEKAADMVTRMVNQLDDSLAASHPLEDMADTLKLRIIKIPAIDADGKTPNGKEPDELPAKKDVLQTAYAQTAGETSQVIDDKNGDYVVVRTDDITPAHAEPFDKVKDKVQIAWTRQQQAERAKAEAEEIAKALRDGKKATAYAGTKGIEVRLSKPISLLGQMDNDIPTMAYSKILQMKKGDVITVPTAERQFIMRLTDIVPVDPARPDATHLKVVKEYDDKLPYELIDQYSSFLNKRFPVDINQELFDTMKKQGS